MLEFKYKFNWGEIAMFLRNAEVGKEYIVSGLWLDKKLARRLETLGMTRGCRILVMHKKASGTMVVKVRGTRFALGGGIAQGIALQ